MVFGINLVSSTHIRRNFLFLVGAAVFITITWRTEVEMRGWEGLK
jgi:hypothetical protein